MHPAPCATAPTTSADVSAARDVVKGPDPHSPLTDAECAAIIAQLTTTSSLLLAVSGGVDSIVLLHLVARQRATPLGRMWLETGDTVPGLKIILDDDTTLPKKRPLFSAHADWLDELATVEDMAAAIARNRVVVVTVDHRLREGSAADAAFVAAHAKSLGVPHRTLAWVRHPESPAEQTAGVRTPAPRPARLQERAREARYGLLADLVNDEQWRLGTATARAAPSKEGSPLATSGQRVIVTAHHADDQIETFLMRLARGSGIDGLSAMRRRERFTRPAVPERPYRSNYDVVRPLLGIPKSRLVATARAWGVSWREDPSNDDPHFERVRLRQASRSLGDLGLTAPALLLSISRLQRTRERVREYQKDQMHAWATGNTRRLWTHAGLFVELELIDGIHGAQFFDLVDPRAERSQRLLAHAIELMGGGTAKPEPEEIDRLYQHFCADVPTGGHSARTLGGCRLDVRDVRFRRRVRVWREVGRNPPFELTLEPGDSGTFDQRFFVAVGQAAPGPVTIRALGNREAANLVKAVPEIKLWRDVPPGALETLPGVFDDTGLLTVPYFDRAIPCLPGWLQAELSETWLHRFGRYHGFYAVRAPDHA